MAPRKTTETPATETANGTVAVRVTLLLHVQPDAWKLDTDRPELDTDKLVAGMKAAGMSDGEAIANANKIIAARLSETAGVNAIRESVRTYVTDEITKLQRLTDAGVVISDVLAERKLARANS